VPPGDPQVGESVIAGGGAAARPGQPDRLVGIDLDRGHEVIVEVSVVGQVFVQQIDPVPLQADRTVLGLRVVEDKIGDEERRLRGRLVRNDRP
jgi:hypothetical protein